MEFLQSIFLGSLQGFTEFLPISSSGHLYVAETFLGLKPDLNFEILLHAASLLAVAVFFWRDIGNILRDVFLGGEGRALGWKIIVATLFTVPVALLLQSRFELLITFRRVGIALIATGILVFLAEKLRPQQNRNFDWKFVGLLGVVQGLAVLPGLSRSGLTIALLILLGIERRKALEISFLLAIPTILGAFVFSLRDTRGISFGVQEGIAFIVSFLVALAAIRWMMKLIQKNWIWFAPYCIGAGVFVLFFSL